MSNELKPQPPYVEKRPRYFDGQYLKVDDFVNEQEYHIDRQRRTSQFLHVSGILEGLQVNVDENDTLKLKITPGAAIDNEGRQILLTTESEIDIPSTLDRTTTHSLSISWDEVESDQQLEGSQETTRFYERPTIAISEALSSSSVLLAVLRGKGANNPFELDLTSRQYSGLQLPATNGNGVTLRSQNGASDRAVLSGSLNVTQNLQVNGNVGIGTTTPTRKLEVTGDAAIAGNLSVTNGDLLISRPTSQSNTPNQVVGQLSFRGFNRNVNSASVSAESPTWDDQSHLIFKTSNSWNGAVERLRITHDGNVGIGTTTPTRKLEVTGDAAIAGNLSVTGGTSNNLEVDGTSVFLGKVGIGGDLPETTDQLKVTGDATINGSVTIATSGKESDLFYSLLCTHGNTSGFAVHPETSGGTTTVIENGEGGLSINPRGKVGIGGAPGTETLRVTGDAAIEGNLYVKTAGDEGTSIVCEHIGSNFIVRPATPGGSMTVIENTGGGGLSINPRGGNVGIGGDPGTEMLRVTGNTTIAGDLSITATGNTPGTIQAANASLSGTLWAKGPAWFDVSATSFGLGGVPEFTNAKDAPILDMCIYARDRIVCKIVSVFSDKRIKNIQGCSESASDLHTLLGIEITDFHYKDTIGKGNALHKKVIAQQVEKVFPQAVSKHIDVVPDIYQLAPITGGWVALATDLKPGDRVKLIAEQGEEGIYEVMEVAEDKFRTAFKPEGDKVFVFGREVNDFRIVDYDAIAMLNVSATQELYKRLDTLQLKVEHLQASLYQVKPETLANQTSNGQYATAILSDLP